jgi:hypothetical protein
VKARGEEWDIRKAEYYARHPKKCAACGATSGGDVHIHLHHLRYSAGIGSEPDEDLVPLCEEHHNAVHLTQLRSIPSLPDATRHVIEVVSGRPWTGGVRRGKRPSKNLRLIAAQQERIRELEAENERLRDELRVAVMVGGTA